MKLNKYQEEARKTVKSSIRGNKTYFTLGLCGESGEIAEKVKKLIRDGRIDQKDLVAELGDVLWYLSQLADCFGVTLSEVAEQNIEKLQSRKQRGKIGGSGDNR